MGTVEYSAERRINYKKGVVSGDSSPGSGLPESRRSDRKGESRKWVLKKKGHSESKKREENRDEEGQVGVTTVKVAAR